MKEEALEDKAKAEAKIKDEGKKATKATKIKKTNEKSRKKVDKITGEYNGKKVYPDPKGGKYYINTNRKNLHPGLIHLNQNNK